MRVLAFIGPSGSGKSTLVRALHDQGLIQLTPSWTTRPARAEELRGTLEHRFVDEAEFDELVTTDFFLEVVRLFDLPYRYGLPRLPLASELRAPIPAIMVRASLLPLVARHFPDHLVYQIEDTFEHARDRLQARRVLDQTTGLELGTRLEGYEGERLLGREVARRTFVNRTTIAELVEEVSGAIAADFNIDRSEEACPSEA